MVVVIPLSELPETHAEPRPLLEYSVKAAFLYNFARFVEWPESAFEHRDAPITFCILGEDPFGATIDKTLQNKRIHNRALIIRRHKSVGQIKACHILFISTSEKQRLRQILESVQDQNVVTVSEMEGFARHGGIINLIIEDQRVRFEVNLDAAEQNQLKISSRVLKLAKVVLKRGQAGRN